MTSKKLYVVTRKFDFLSFLRRTDVKELSFFVTKVIAFFLILFFVVNNLQVLLDLFKSLFSLLKARLSYSKGLMNKRWSNGDSVLKNVFFLNKNSFFKNFFNNKKDKLDLSLNFDSFKKFLYWIVVEIFSLFSFLLFQVKMVDLKKFILNSIEKFKFSKIFNYVIVAKVCFFNFFENFLNIINDHLFLKNQ